MVEVPGRLILTLQDNRNIQMVFVPNGIDGNPMPLLAKDTGHAESDLVTTFEFSDAKARELIAELEQKGQVDVVINIDEGKVASLFKPRNPMATSEGEDMADWTALSERQRNTIQNKILAALSSMAIQEVRPRWQAPGALPHWQLILETLWCASRSHSDINHAREEAIRRAGINVPMNGVVLKKP